MSKLEFFDFFKEIAIKNPNINFNSSVVNNAIYDILIRLGVSDEDTFRDIYEEGMFDYFIKHFNNSKNINVFVDPEWSYFCQFVNGKIYYNPEYIKIYIPLDYNHVKDGTTMIFDFLNNNNIKHISKIGKEIRFDNIVVRVTNKDDALKLIDYVNNNNYIKEGLINPNPFAFNYNNIALACDGELSYNTILSTYIGLYLNNKQKENKLNEIDYKDFDKFLNNYYMEAFVYKNKLNDFKNNFNIHSINKIINAMQITELIISSSNPRFNLDSYMTHFNNCCNKKLVDKKYTELRNHLNNLNYIEDEELIKTNNLLLKSLSTMIPRYGYDQTICNLDAYVSTGNYKFITRNNDLRNILVDYEFDYKIKKLLSIKKMTLKEYSNSLMNFNQINDNLQIDNTLLEYLKIMSIKYNETLAIINLKTFLLNGNKKCITRENDLRNRICSPEFTSKLKKTLENKNISIESYLDFIKQSYKGKSY